MGSMGMLDCLTSPVPHGGHQVGGHLILGGITMRALTLAMLMMLAMLVIVIADFVNSTMSTTNGALGG